MCIIKKVNDIFNFFVCKNSGKCFMKLKKTLSAMGFSSQRVEKGQYIVHRVDI